MLDRVGTDGLLDRVGTDGLLGTASAGMLRMESAWLMRLVRVLA